MCRLLSESLVVCLRDRCLERFCFYFIQMIYCSSSETVTRHMLMISVYGNPQVVDIQEKLNLIINWSNISRILLNKSKCCVLHSSPSNPLKEYYLNTSELNVKTSQKDLGIIVTNSISWTDHSVAAAGKARRVLYLLKHVFSNPSMRLV
jgi:hypothetical protein